jgi:hypothetical protein
MTEIEENLKRWTKEEGPNYVNNRNWYKQLNGTVLKQLNEAKKNDGD